MKYCKICGAEVVSDGIYCPKCGATEFSFDKKENNHSAEKNITINTDQIINDPRRSEMRGKHITIIVILLVLVIAICISLACLLLFKKEEKSVEHIAEKTNESEEIGDTLSEKEAQDVDINEADEYLGSTVDENIDIESQDNNDEEKIETVDNDVVTTWYDFSENSGFSTSFYGIMCASSEDKQEAVRIAQEMVKVGLSGQIFYSESWSGFQGEYSYIVSAGSYTSEAEANISLYKVRKYYPEAYVKYSGQFINNLEQESESNASNDIEYLIKIASERQLTEDDLKGYSSFELSAVRNGIYALHGYVFQTREWNDYFYSFDWYHPDPNFLQDQVSKIENKNSGFIRAFEEEYYGGVYSFK